MNEVIDPETGEVTDVAVRQHSAVSPQQQIAYMEELVQAVAAKCRGPKFISDIQGKQYPKVEWWTTVGATQGLCASEVYSKRVTCVEHDGKHWGYEAKAEVHDSTGRQRGSASMVCMSCEIRSKKTGAKWGDAGEYAVKSMAYTRSVSKSFRVNLSYLAVMAGLQATAAEEIPSDGFDDSPADRGHGMCPIHNVPFLQTDKQKQNGYPPSHKADDGWCEKQPETVTKAPESADRRDAINALIEMYGEDREARLAYIRDITGREEISHPDDVDDAEWPKVKAAVMDDLAAQQAPAELEHNP